MSEILLDSYYELFDREEKSLTLRGSRLLRKNRRRARGDRVGSRGAGEEGHSRIPVLEHILEAEIPLETQERVAHVSEIDLTLVNNPQVVIGYEACKGYWNDRRLTEDRQELTA